MYRLSDVQLMGVRMDAQSVLAFIGGYVAAAVMVFLLYLPVLALFVVLLVVAGILQLIALPFILLIRRLRGRESLDSPSDGSWLLH